MTGKQHQFRKPISKYSNKVLVKGLNPETSEEGLINYLEVKSGEDVIDITYGQEEGTVLVTFEELRGLLFYLFFSIFPDIVNNQTINYH